MDELLKKIICAPGVSGYEGAVANIMKQELASVCDEVNIDNFGNIIASKGKGGRKIMIAAHMDEIGLVVKHVNDSGYIHFIKIGGIDDRILVGQRVIVRSKKGDVLGIIGTKPPHLQKDEDRKLALKYEDMFIDIGSPTKKEALSRVSVGDPVIFEPNAGSLHGKLLFGKAIDDRVGCFALIKIMQKLKVNAEVYAVATTQEEVGLKGARTSSFKINPDFAIAIDTTIAGDSPGIKETESSLKLGLGAAITVIEASGRGVIVNEKIKDLFIETARRHKIKCQISILEGGMTDGAIIYMNREGIPTGVLSVPCRYIHAPTGVFHSDDVSATVDLAVKVIETVVSKRLF